MFLNTLFSRKRTTELAVQDPVAEFRRELGLEEQKVVKHSWLARVILAANNWASNGGENGLCNIAAATAVFTFIVALASHFYLGILIIPIMIFAAWFAGICKEEYKHLVFTGVLAINAILWSIFGYPWIGSPLAAVVLVVYLFNGIRLAGSLLEEEPKKSKEESVARIFDSFVAKHRPDLLEENSTLNQELSGLSARITKLNHLLFRYQGELEVESRRPDGHAEAIVSEMKRVKSAVEKLEAEKSERQKAKGELLEALQVFEAIKADATSYVRFESLTAEADQLIGEGSRNSERAEREVERIKGSIVAALLRMNRAAEQLGLSAISRLDDPGMKYFQSGSESVAAESIGREKRILRLG